MQGPMVTHPLGGGGTSSLRGRSDECALLDEVIVAARSGESRSLVLRGEPGIGKSALLDYVASRAGGCRVARAAGVESEMELPMAAVQQLLGPALLERAESLPPPQRDALRRSFGLIDGPVPDLFLVGMAVLGAIADLAHERPLICLIDDAQWLDAVSTRVLSFVARRLEAESVGMMFATRGDAVDLEGLPVRVVQRLDDRDAAELLDSVLVAPIDELVRDQIISESRRSSQGGSGFPRR